MKSDASTCRRIITDRQNRLLVIHFTKRSDGKHRRMLAMYNDEGADKRHFPFNVRKKKLIPVFDCEKEALRMVPLDGIESIRDMKTGAYFEGTDLQSEMETLEAEMSELFGTTSPAFG